MTLSSSLLKSVLTDLYTESKERDWNWQWQLVLRKVNNLEILDLNIEDLSDLLKSTRMSVKSEDFNGYSEHSEDLYKYTDILDILEYPTIQYLDMNRSE